MVINPNQIKEKKIVGQTSDGQPVLMVLTHGGLYAFFTRKNGSIETLSTGAHRGIASWMAEKREPTIKWNAEFLKSEESTTYETLKKALFIQVPEELRKAKIYSLASGRQMADYKPTGEVRSTNIDESDPTHLDIAKQLPQGHPARKGSMLVVGTHSYMRPHLGDTLNDRDVHLLFHPQSAPHWHVGAISLDQQNHGHYFHSRHHDVNQAISDVLRQVKEHAKSPQPGGHNFTPETAQILRHSIYRQPKISLKDVTQLEPYSASHQQLWEQNQAKSGEPVYDWQKPQNWKKSEALFIQVPEE